ncbi:MAG: hypothetical protein WKG01_37525 [Kofleriaceae bacterium]
MSTIGGPGGIGGPKGPGGPDGPDGPEGPDGPDGPDATGGATGAAGTAGTAGTAGSERAAPTQSTDIEALAAEIAAGRLTPKEAVDRLVDATAGPELGASERAELRALLSDLVANDPHLGGLLGRV